MANFAFDTEHSDSIFSFVFTPIEPMIISALGLKEQTVYYFFFPDQTVFNQDNIISLCIHTHMTANDILSISIIKMVTVFETAFSQGIKKEEVIKHNGISLKLLYYFLQICMLKVIFINVLQIFLIYHAGVLDSMLYRFAYIIS